MPAETTLSRTIARVTIGKFVEILTPEPGPYYALQLSPDGTALAIDMQDPRNRDIWTYDMTRRTLERLTYEPGIDSHPIWTHDGLRVIFSSQPTGTRNLFWAAADHTGQPERLTESAYEQMPFDVTADGKSLVYRETGSGGDYDIGVFSFEDRSTELILSTNFNENNPALSPDGNWIAFETNESGENRVYVRPFPEVQGGRWEISEGAGQYPLWSPSGGEVFYWSS